MSARAFYQLDVSCDDRRARHGPSYREQPTTGLFVRNLTKVALPGGGLHVQAFLAGHDSDLAEVPSGRACSEWLNIVATSGADSALPNVSVHRRGYQVSVMLWATQLRHWNLSATMEWYDFDRRPWEHSKAARAHTSVGLTASRHEPGCLPLARQPVLSLFSVELEATDAANVLTAAKAGELAEPCTRAELSLMGVISGAWQPLPGTCRLEPATPARVRSILQGKWLLFSGQSTLLEPFVHLLTRATNGTDWTSHSKIPGSLRAMTDQLFNSQSRSCAVGHPNYFARDFDTMPNSSKLPPGARLTMMNNAHISSCRNGMGLASLITLNSSRANNDSLSDQVDWTLAPRGLWLASLLRSGNSTPSWLRAFATTGHSRVTVAPQFREAILQREDDGAARGFPHGPNVLVINSGLHDLYYVSDEFGLSEYEQRLKALWTLIKDSRHPALHVIWMTTGRVHEVHGRTHGGAPNHTKNCTDDTFAHPIPVIRLMNQIAVGLAHAHGADVLYQDRMRELRPADGDGMHCIRGAVCQGTLDTLVRLIELGPPSAEVI